MTEKEIKFINDILKPWDELNDLLANPFAYEPGLNDATRMAGNIAIHLNSVCDLERKSQSAKKFRSAIHARSPENKIMSDVADMIKHHTLGDKTRENKLSTIAAFECLDQKDKFKFLRTIIEIAYTDSRKFDFMIESAKAINFWINHLNLNISKQRIIKLSNEDFQDQAVLHYNPLKCVHMKSTRIQIYRRNKQDILELFDPKNVKLVLYELKPR